ncbi:MAG: radical SAM protein [Planctomycetes bacterium]|nr:radical SAM protein [Planctomycetota bacterium]
MIEITNRCNLRCPHCASTSGIAREDELSYEEIRSLLATIAELGGEEVTLIGGEVFLRDDWFEIGQAVNHFGMKLILISNGLLIRDDETFQRLRHLQPLLIGISVDGASRESYRRSRGIDGFDHCLAVLRRLRDEGHDEVNAITTLMKSNLREFDEFVALFDNTGIAWQVQIANKGGSRFSHEQFITRDEYAWLTGKMRDVFVDRADTFKLRHMDDFGYFPMDPKLRFLHQMWHGCIAGLELIGVRSNGAVLGCLSLGDDFVEVNLRDVPLPEIWHSARYFRRFREKEDLLAGECARCPHARQCRAGCTSIAWSATQSVGCNPYCIRQIEVESVLGDLITGRLQ